MIELRDVSARAGQFALRDVSFRVERGQWGIVLGPAGAGKTTLLEVIAGVRTLAAGRVLLRDEDASRRPPESRKLGIVYQHGYLFPHLGVQENVAYGARTADDVREVSDRLAISVLESRPVHALSGGERQVVALARALASRPDILLLDEPFAALDPRGRARVRDVLRQLQRERGLTVLHVTHDFNEAGTLGDIAIVMEAGRVAQSGSPSDVFHAPATAAVADFVGAENVIAGDIVREAAGQEPAALTFVGEGLRLSAIGTHPGGRGHAVIRGEEIVLATHAPEESSARNALRAVVSNVSIDGVLARITLRVADTTLLAVITAAAARELQLAEGSPVVATIKATAVHLC